MKKKNRSTQAILMAGVGVLATPLVASESLSALQSLSVNSAEKPSLDCTSVYAGQPCPVVLTEQEEAKIRSNINTLNELEIINVLNLSDSLVARNCPYGMPCPGELEKGIADRREKAAKLESLLEAASDL